MFCETEWPMFGVNLSSQGTIDFQIAWTVVNITLGKPSHPDKIGYILPWAAATFNSHPLMKVCIVHNR